MITKSQQNQILEMIDSAAQGAAINTEYDEQTGLYQFDPSEAAQLASRRHLLLLGVWIGLGDSLPPAWQINIACGRTDRVFEDWQKQKDVTAKLAKGVAGRDVLGTQPSQ